MAAIKTQRGTQLAGCPLESCPEAYSRSLKCFKASLEPGKHPTTECIESHVPTMTRAYIGELLEDHSPFRILSVGSGNGTNDLSFIEMLSKICREKVEKCHFFQRTIEPDGNVLQIFQAKAEDLPESLKSRADIEFEWLPMTYQEYVKQKKVDIIFDLVHFFHSLYFLDIEEALKHCYERELGTKGVIVCAVRTEKSALVRYGRTFSCQGLILNHGFHCSSKDVTDVAKKNGWKYVECPGEIGKPCDITTVFDQSSVQGNILLDFLTQWVDVRVTASPENLEKILNFWEEECSVDGCGRKLIMMRVCTILIFKGI